VSEKDEKDSLALLSPSSLSDASELHSSLEMCLLEVVQGLRGSSQATLKLHGLFLEIKERVEARDATIEETHRRIGELRAETADFAELARTQIFAIKQLIAVAVDNRQSIDKSNKQIAATHLEISQQFALMSPEDESIAPSHLHKALDIVWPHAMRASRKVVVIYLTKVAVAGTFFGTFMKILIDWAKQGL